MLRTEPMEKLRMLFLENDRDAVIGFLHKEGVVDLRKSKLELSDYSASSDLPVLSELQIKIAGAMQLLDKQEVHGERHLGRKELIKKASSLDYVPKIFAINERIKRLKEDLEYLNYAESVASYMAGMDVNFSELESNSLAFRAFVLSTKDAKAFSESMKKSKVEHVSIEKRLDRKLVALFVAYGKAAQIDEHMKGMKLEELDLHAQYLKGRPEDTIKMVKEKKAADEREMAKLVSQLKEMNKHYSELANYNEMLGTEIERASASANFKRTERTFVVEGWVPAKKLKRLTEGLERVTRGEFAIETIEKDELAPTLVSRPKFLKPFDYMMEFLSVPRSDEIDPTWIFILSFPIFYGLMISDVGYGMISLLFVTWITTFTNPNGLVYNTAKIWQLTSIAAIVFGFLSNQYLGFGLNQYIGLGAAFDWLKDTTTLLLITIFFGIFQVSLGLIFGFINKYKHREKKLALSKLTSLAIVLSGVFAVGGAFFGIVSYTYTIVAATIAVASLVATVVLSGIEATEITSLMTHPLSYTRIAGFGMASVIIAMLIDRAFTPTLGHGILIFVLLLIIFIILHFLNMIMAIFEGAVQGIRLNFVEFFSKFYVGGGIKFKPFAYKRIYTKE